MKKLIRLCLISTFVLLLSMITVSAETEGYYTYFITNNEATIQSVETDIYGNVAVPDTLGGCLVTAVGTSAFDGCDDIVSIKLPNTIEIIGDYAFWWCSSLVEVELPANLTYLGKGAFQQCSSLKRIKIPDGLVKIEDSTFNGCWALENVHIPEGIKEIGDFAFSWCKFSKILIPDGVTKIGRRAFDSCGATIAVLPDTLVCIEEEAFYNYSSFEGFYYKGTKEQFLKIDIADKNDFFDIYPVYHNIREITVKFEDNSSVVCYAEKGETYEKILSKINKEGFETELYTDRTMTEKCSENMQVIEDIDLYCKYKTKQCTYKYLNDDGSVLWQNVVDYGSAVVLTEKIPVKEATAQYSYTFVAWEGFKEDMMITKDIVFTPKFTEVINWYTYKFMYGDVCYYSATRPYGEKIIKPDATPTKDAPYTFDKWEGYTEDMVVTKDEVFSATFRYLSYKIDVYNLNGGKITKTITYNDEYTLPISTEDEYVFMGYYTLKDGKGTKLTDEKGNSVTAYNYCNNISAYPYFVNVYIDKIVIGNGSAEIGEKDIRLPVKFATMKTAEYFVATIEIPEKIKTISVNKKDFEVVTSSKPRIENGYTYVDIVAKYKENDGTIPLNCTVNPFDICIDIPEDAQPSEIVIEMSDAYLSGECDYIFDEIINGKLQLTAKLAEYIVISGVNEIDKPEKFSATVYPEYTTDKSVRWSLSDPTDAKFATVTEDGVVTPLENGTIKLMVTALDGSGIYETISVTVVKYAEIDDVNTDVGVWDIKFSPAIREYTVYVPIETHTVNITPEFTNGNLYYNEMLALNNKKISFYLDKIENIIIFKRAHEGYTTCNYVVKVIKTTDVKNIKLINEQEEEPLILTYDKDKTMIELFRKKMMRNEEVVMTVDKNTTSYKFVYWESLANLKPKADFVYKEL